MSGFEVSYFAFFDKNGFAKLGYALDHKRAFNNDEGPNTGEWAALVQREK